MFDPAHLPGPVSPAKLRQLFYHFKLHARSDAAAKLAIGLVAPLYSHMGIPQAKKENFFLHDRSGCKLWGIAITASVVTDRGFFLESRNQWTR